MKLLIVIALTLFSFCKPSDKELEKEINANETSFETAYDSNEILFVNARGGLRLRSETSTKSNVITLIPEGSFVSVIEQTKVKENIEGIHGVWIKIKFNSFVGYSFNNFLCKISEDSDNINRGNEKCKDEIDKLNEEFLKYCANECISLKKYRDGDAGSFWELPAVFLIKNRYFSLSLKYEQLNSRIIYAKKVKNSYHILYSIYGGGEFGEINLDSKSGTGTTRIEFNEKENKMYAEDIHELLMYSKNNFNKNLIEYVKK